jgi:hypothetical protein
MPKDGIFHSYSHENLKSYIILNCLKCLLKYCPTFRINLKRLIFPLHEISMEAAKLFYNMLLLLLAELELGH